MFISVRGIPSIHNQRGRLENKLVIITGMINGRQNAVVILEPSRHTVLSPTGEA
jgi:hypothetical protein